MQYISTRNYNEGFFSFNEATGLQPVAGVGPNQCPPGRILIENGRKLYPGIHNTVRTIMTRVFDSVSQISGFIDTKSAIFAMYSVKYALGEPDGLDYNPRGVRQEGVPHKGQSVYTLGDVVTGGQFYAIKTIDLGAASYINADFSETTNYTMTLTQNTELNALVPPSNNGTVIYLSVIGDGNSTLNFGLNFKGLITELKPNQGEKITIGLISDSTSLSIISVSGYGIKPAYQVVTF